MVVYPEFAQDGPLLAPHFGNVDIGLHFTLTADRPATSVMRNAYLGQLDRGYVRAELARQLSRFVEIMGRQPDHIDGHQHVHLLPGVREAVIETASRIGASVRSTREPIGVAMFRRPSPVEAAFLSWTAGPLQSEIRKHGILTNRGFRGPRTFQEAGSYRPLFRKMIVQAENGCMVMCHPGHVDHMLAERDAITHPREDELRYFVGDLFVHDLEDAGLTLGTMRDVFC